MIQTALITGGTSGIGYELAKLFAKNGYNLVVIARDKEKLVIAKQELEKMYSIQVETLAKDAALPSSAKEIFDFITIKNIPIDVLVNNAGFGKLEKFAEGDWNIDEQMMQVNMITLTHLTRLFLPGMIERKKGKILNLASTAAFQPGPFMAIYYASKSYVLSFSVALFQELRGTGVSVTALCPGPTKTGFQKRSGMENIQSFSKNSMDAGVVAKIGYAALMQGKPIAIAGFRNTILALASRLVSINFAARIARRFQKLI